MSKLLEEAIADAKAVRATALANAKAALEEAFLPRAEAMLSQKLKEEASMEEEGDEEGMEEEFTSSDISAGKVGGSGKSKGYKSAADVENNRGLDFGRPKFKEGMEEEGSEEAMKEDGEEESKMRDEGDYAPTSKSRTGGHLAPRAFKEDAEEEDNVSDEELDEILAELSKEMDETGEVPAAPAPAPMPAAPQPEVPMAPVPQQAPVPPQAPAPVMEDGEEEVDLNELLASLNEDTEEEGSEEEEEEEEVCEKCGSSKCKCEEEAIQSELNEANEGIKYLRKQLNEVNLLNAKLLYTNKLFKQANLTNEQKMKIIETFDLTQTIREVKIAYTSLAESFNFGRSTVKKSNTVAKTITEGLASKPVASTKPAKNLIVENTNAQAQRFQTLAGIKKAK